MELVQWCNICNAAPSDGVLKVENPFDPKGEPLDLEACIKCVEKLPWEGGKVNVSKS